MSQTHLVIAYALAALLGSGACSAETAASAPTAPALVPAAAPAASAPRSTGPLSISRFDYFDTYLSYPQGGVRVGQAWNTISGQPLKSFCVKGVSQRMPSSSPLTTRYWEIYDREDLVSALNVSAEGSYGTFSGSAKYARETKLEKEFRKVLVVVEAVHYVESLEPPDWAALQAKGENPQLGLTPTAEGWLGGPDGDQAFVERCGNAYVSAVLFGASLEGLMTYKMDASEVKTSISANAGGSFGVGRGSASLSSTNSKKLMHQETKVDALQHGKGLRNVKNGLELQALVSDPKMAQLDETNAAAYRIIITPYVALPGWPTNRRIGSLSPWMTRVYWGLKERLDQLGTLYQEAYEFPYRFYSPFQKNPDEVRESSRALLAAARCMEELVDYCSRRSDCDVKVMLEQPAPNNRCPLARKPDAMAQLTATEQAKALSLLVPKEGRDLTLADESLKKNPAYAPVLGALDAVQRKLPAIDAVAGPDDEATPPPVAMYYDLLARAPMRRVLAANPKNFDLNRTDADETKRLENTCEFLECNMATYSVLSQYSGVAAKQGAPQAFPDAAAKAYRDWVLRARLRPAADTYCAISRRHPMCVAVKPFEERLETLYAHAGDYPPQAISLEMARLYTSSSTNPAERALTALASGGASELIPIKLPKLPKVRIR